MKLGLLTGVILIGVVPSQDQSAPFLLRTSAVGVVLDMSVTDSAGQPVLDIDPGEIEIKEDGSSQRVLALTLVHDGVVHDITASTSGSTPPTSPTTVQSNLLESAAKGPEVAPSITALLFDQLSPEARGIATQAALAYLRSFQMQTEYGGIFSAGPSLHVVQSFTNDAARLKSAIGAVNATGSVARAAVAEVSATGRVQNYLPGQSPTAGAEATGGFSQQERSALMAGTTPDKILLRMELRMTEGYQRLAAEYEGESSLAALRSLVDGLAVVHGRKDIVYFTEAVTVTARLRSSLDRIIGLANRYNITIHTVDAAGLRAHSMEAQVARSVNMGGAQGLGDQKRSDGPMTRDLEAQQTEVSSKPSAVLGRIAKETGGSFIENTNDVAQQLTRIQNQRRSYYLVAYQPTHPFDGSYRRVTIKVKRSKVRVQHRIGYLATDASPKP